MACDFSSAKIAGEDKVLLTHVPQGAGDPGFGLAQGASVLRITGPGVNAVLGTPTLWLPNQILAPLPANLGPGAYVLTASIAGPPMCTSNAPLDITADVLADLLFTAVSPAAAPWGATVEIINTKPGFVWDAATHGPVDLRTTADALVNPPPQVISGWGTNRLRVTLPPAVVNVAQEPIAALLFSFDGFSQRVPISVTQSNIDLLIATIVVPFTAIPGQVVQLINTSVTWSSAQHGVPQMVDQNDFVAGAQPSYVSGWGSNVLTIRLPPYADFPAAPGLHPMRLKFLNSAVRVAFVINGVPLPRVFWIRTLDCIQTEDATGGDECRLEVNADDIGWQNVIPRVVSLNNGESHPYNWPVVFVDKIQVRLFDEDVGGPIDKDDKLGTRSWSGEERRAFKFTGDDAEYVLNFTIESIDTFV